VKKVRYFVLYPEDFKEEDLSVDLPFLMGTMDGGSGLVPWNKRGEVMQGGKKRTGARNESLRIGTERWEKHRK